MASAFTFWQLLDDEADFFSLVGKDGELCAYQSLAVSSPDEVIPQSIDSLLANIGPLQIDFLPKTLAHNVVIEARSGGYGVSTQKSPVISYRRGNIGADVVGMSNLAMYKSFPSPDGLVMLAKEPEYIAWSKKVFACAKRLAPERLSFNGYMYPASRRIKNAVESGNIKLTF